MPATRDDDRAERLRQAIRARKEARTGASDLVPRPAGEPALLGDAQRSLWFVHQLDPQSPAYSVASAFRLRGQLDPAKLQRAFDVVVARHRLLRCTFEQRQDAVVQVDHPAYCHRHRRGPGGRLRRGGHGDRPGATAVRPRTRPARPPAARRRSAGRRSAGARRCTTSWQTRRRSSCSGRNWRWRTTGCSSPPRRPSSTTTTSTGCASTSTPSARPPSSTGGDAWIPCPASCGFRSSVLPRPAPPRAAACSDGRSRPPRRPGFAPWPPPPGRRPSRCSRSRSGCCCTATRTARTSPSRRPRPSARIARRPRCSATSSTPWSSRRRSTRHARSGSPSPSSAVTCATRSRTRRCPSRRSSRRWRRPVIGIATQSSRRCSCTRSQARRRRSARADSSR